MSGKEIEEPVAEEGQRPLSLAFQFEPTPLLSATFFLGSSFLALKTAFTHSSNVIIDKFIAGRELRCSVVEVVDQSGNFELIPMPPQEYHVSKVDIRKFVDKLAVDENGLPVGKAPSTKTSFICKEKEPVLYEKIQKLALKVHRCLQFKDFSMIDIRVDSEGNPFVLEVNLFCSFGPKASKH